MHDAEMLPSWCIFCETRAIDDLHMQETLEVNMEIIGLGQPNLDMKSKIPLTFVPSSECFPC
jgi:hypothetical protein